MKNLIILKVMVKCNNSKPHKTSFQFCFCYGSISGECTGSFLSLGSQTISSKYLNLPLKSAFLLKTKGILSHC